MAAICDWPEDIRARQALIENVRQNSKIIAEDVPLSNDTVVSSVIKQENKSSNLIIEEDNDDEFRDEVIGYVRASGYRDETLE
jgi:hypothetical protein